MHLHFTEAESAFSYFTATRAYLERQSWPHEQTRLVLFDTSHDAAFSAGVRDWMAGCDYSDVRHVRQRVANANVADEDRRNGDVWRQVVEAMWRIYNRMLELVETEYVWVLEDDEKEPPPGQMPMLRVVVPSGKVGYVPADALSPLGNDQLCYVKDATGWKIGGFVGGDE